MQLVCADKMTGLYPMPRMISILLTYPADTFDWTWVSSTADVTLQEVLDNIELPWNWIALSMNPSITHL